MADVTFDEVWHLAEQLTPQEQKALIARLEAEVQEHEAGQTQADFARTFGLLVFDTGAWPAALTLRREDEYGDDER